MTNDYFYRTGDLARWLPDGNIEFLGRIDYQVKVRGFRVELGEIENRLLNNPGIKEAVVLAHEEEKGDKYLCAYIVSDKELEIAELRKSLLTELPGYMIPTYFVKMEKIPLTSNGKADRKALPKPGLTVSDRYTAPRNELEKKLVAIWNKILNPSSDSNVRIGINDNFFELGGHSLKATTLSSRIHKELNINVPLAQIFKTPTIRGLSQYIGGTVEEIYESIIPVEEKEYYDLSFAQRRMYILQQIDLSGTAYNMPQIIPLLGEVDINQLEETFQKLINRHESLRTSFHIIGDEPRQRVHREVGFKIEKYQDADPHRFVRAFDLSRAPLLRVGEFKTSTGKHYLVVDMHHIISDGISGQVLRDDFRALYQQKELPSLRIQYKDFAQWQNSPGEIARLHQQQSYWLDEFSGEIPVLEIPTDYPRPISQSFTGDNIDFELTFQETGALNRLALENGATLFMVLTTAINILLSKLCGQEEIIIGIPIAGRRHSDLEKIIGMFVNTLALRNYPMGEQTYLQFLGNLKEKVLMAFENQEYPFEELVDKLSLKRDMGRNPLFDVMFVLQNMSNPSTVERPQPSFDEEIIETAKFDLSIGAVESGQKILFSIQYCTALFTKKTIERFITYFKKIILAIINEPGIKLQQMDVLSEKEKEQLLVEFNNTDELYPLDKTIYQLFTEQVTKTPDHIAAIGELVLSVRSFGPISLTYRQINEQAQRLAGLLIQKGVLADDIVALMAERSVEMIVGIMGILKSGGAYLPINSDYPRARINFMVKDSGTKILLTANEIASLSKESVFDSQHLSLSGHPSSHSSHLAYLIYTSGSTGNPRGVGVEHRSVVNLVYGLKEKVYRYEYPVSIALISPIYFDASVKQIFPALILGHRLVIVSQNDLLSGRQLLHLYIKYNITVSDGTPSHLVILLDDISKLHLPYKIPVKRFVIGGDVLNPALIRKLLELLGPGDEKSELEIVNVYGPTECCDVTASFAVTGDNIDNYRRIPIGTPLGNVKVVIVGKWQHLQPMGVAGELCISGAGLGRGYLNQPELTAEKFGSQITLMKNKNSALRADFHHSAFDLPRIQHSNLYCTGDLARWLPDGNIEFIGRIDNQVKIRGYRIELGEIENRLLKYPGIKEAVLAAREEIDNGGNYLCAYIVSDGKCEVTLLREFILKGLPDYMLPSYFMQLEKIPLTPNGKVDRKALPKPGLNVDASYTAPRNEIEKKLVALWSEILKRSSDAEDRIGIDVNFFELGGHSLKATVLASRIHKELNARVPLAEIFKTPTIRGLAEFMRGTAEEIYESIVPVEEKEYYALSFAQKRMYILQQIDLKSTAYNMPQIIPLPGEIDFNKLEESFKKLIQRHESLRTSFHMIDDQLLQKVHHEVDFKIEKYEGALVNQFFRPFDLSKAPLLRVGQFKSGEGRNYLAVDMHHIISDGISNQVLREDFKALFERKELPQLRIQYKDFAQWQNSPMEVERLQRQMIYWMNEFAGEIPVLEIPTDYPRPIPQSFAGESVRFELTDEETRDLNKLALQGKATLFMILMAAVNILLSKLSGQEEIIIGTPIAGRRHSDLEKIIGMFINTLVLRNHINGNQTFKEFLAKIKENVLKDFENQEYPFEELVDKLSLKRDMGRNPLFDVMFVLQNIGNHATIENTQPDADEEIIKTAKFDLTFIAEAFGQKIFFTIQYCTKLFKKETIQRFVDYFKMIISQIIQNPGLKLREIEITLAEERRQLLSEFNNTECIYSNDKTIHQLFAEQVQRTPDHIALFAPSVQPVGLSYRKLNEQSNQLAGMLIHKGVLPDDIVGIMVERSLEMIIGLLGILKSGGAYLPLNPKNPSSRTQYMLKDSGAKLLVTTNDKEVEKMRGWEGE
ncbi:MAG: amino acid adenylation domain-containing protein, partial [Acidobacteria bacterium]|nr:amino acid adenylation domain-containing protein [Acidobacteriota bacterium]